MQAQFEIFLHNSGRTGQGSLDEFFRFLDAPHNAPSLGGALQLPFKLGNEPSGTEEQPQLPPLCERFVAHAAAGANFSVAVTGTGEVWTFGCGAERQLATGNWIQTDARPVTGRVAAMLSENGGAVDVAAGESFCLALARNGCVILWGRMAPDGHVCNSRGIRLPGMIKIAAGKQHALMSDGESVWQLKLRGARASPDLPGPVRLQFNVCFLLPWLPPTRICHSHVAHYCQCRMQRDWARPCAEIPQRRRQASGGWRRICGR